MRKIHQLIFTALVFLIFCLSPNLAKAQEVDIELVMAVDGSRSVDNLEYILQLEGIASAFRDPTIHQAIQSGANSRIAVALMIWASGGHAKIKSDWYILHSAESSNRFADVVSQLHQIDRISEGRIGVHTSIGDGIRHATAMINSNQVNAQRRIIDVSGDGIETRQWMPGSMTLPQARLNAATYQIIINGLAILTDFPGLEGWYKKYVTVGSNSFVIEAENFESFKEAFLRKLGRELSHPIAQHTPKQHERCSSICTKPQLTAQLLAK